MHLNSNNKLCIEKNSNKHKVHKVCRAYVSSHRFLLMRTFVRSLHFHILLLKTPHWNVFLVLFCFSFALLSNAFFFVCTLLLCRTTDVDYRRIQYAYIDSICALIMQTDCSCSCINVGPNESRSNAWNRLIGGLLNWTLY